MDTDRILNACEVLNWFTRQCLAMPEDDALALTPAATLTAANLLLLQYVQHVHGGMEPYDALVLTARGDDCLRTKLLQKVASQVAPSSP